MTTVPEMIAVLGPGGVGGFLAAALAAGGGDAVDGAVVVVARESTASVINVRGIDVRSVRLGDFVAHPRAVSVLDEPVDSLIVATKAVGLDDALTHVSVTPPLVVPLLNGLEHMDVLRSRFAPSTVAAGAIRIEADRPAPGEIVQTSPLLRIDVASDDAALRPRLERFAAILERAGVPVRIERNEAQALWSKLVRLCALACTTSAADRPIGFIRSDPEWRARLVGCIDEACAVAIAEGAEMSPADRVAELDDAHEGLGSSMQRDIAAGRVPELDAIAGAVLRAGARHGLACPTIAGLALSIAARAGIPAPVV
jgi:2-dehydropantoate 2-reductase